ncbi:unnamed protein product [Symbiodinium sp. CCMP2592]|nr:unnamed protein product [Symbiodinium sp. CCMP2592]
MVHRSRSAGSPLLTPSHQAGQHSGMRSESEGPSGPSGLSDLGHLSDLEHLLPQGLREALRPVERENARLLAALVRSRLCEEQLRRQNTELAELAELRGLRPAYTPDAGASGVAIPEGSLQSVLSQRGKDKALAELQHLEINLAEIVALTLLLRVRDSTTGFRQASVDALRNALEKCSSELASYQVAEERHCHSDAVTASPWTLVQTERDEAQRLRRQQSSVQEIGHGMLLTLSERCVAEEQTFVHEALGKLEAEEQLVVCESDLETEAALENDLQGTELRELGMVQQRLEESIRLTGDLKGESLKWKGQAEQCARLQRELADKAWCYSNQLEENALELEMEIEVAEAQQGHPSVGDVFHLQTLVKPLDGAEERRRRGASELSWALSEASELRRILGESRAEKSLASRSETEAVRDWKRSRKRSSGFREALKQELSALADLREACKGIQAEDREMLSEHREMWKEETWQREEDRKDGTSALAEAVHSEVAAAKEESEVAKKLRVELRVELREMRARQQHSLRHRSPSAGGALFELVELEHTVQQRVAKRDRQLQQLRLSLKSLDAPAPMLGSPAHGQGAWRMVNAANIANVGATSISTPPSPVAPMMSPPMSVCITNTIQVGRDTPPITQRLIMQPKVVHSVRLHPTGYEPSPKVDKVDSRFRASL